MRPTVYVIVHDGREIRSLYRELYRLRYQYVLAGRAYNVDKLTTADNEHQARAQASGDVRGPITVEHVTSLTLESAEAFRSDGHFEEMKAEALEDLKRQVLDAKARADAILSE